MAHSAGQKQILLLVLTALMLCCVTVSNAGGQNRKPALTSVQGGLVKLPIVEKQDLRFLPFSLNGEAPRSRILKVTQDDHGFLWLATTTGLYRYDGYRLKHYQHEPGDPASLSADRLWTVYKDRAGTLWIGTNEGLDRLDVGGDTFTHYRHDPADDRSLSGEQVFSIHQDGDGILWVGTSAGLDRMDPGARGFTHYRHDPGDDATLSDDWILRLHEDRRGNLWVGTRGGLNVLNKATGRISRFKHDPADPHSLGDDYVSGICEDPSGVLWVGSTVLSALDVKTGRFTRYSFHTEVPGAQAGLTGVTSLYVDRTGVLWLCTMNRGLLKLDRERMEFVGYRRDPADPNTLPHDTVLTLFEDAEGVMWVGTQSGLVPVIRKPPFVNYRHSAAKPNSLADNNLVRARRQARKPVDRDRERPQPVGSKNRPIHALPARC